MIKLIVFDLWDTLAYKDTFIRSTLQIFKKIKILIPYDKFVKIYEQSVQTKKWGSKYDAYKNLCKNLGIETSDRNIKLIMFIRDRAEAKTKLFPHTLSMLKQLKKQGYKIGLISNTSTFSIEPLKKTKLLDYIDYPLFSFDVGIIKPNPKIFKILLKKSKCKPEEAIMIGDTFEDDILPAKNIGMNTILFKNYKNLQKKLSEFSIKLNP